MHGYQRKLRFSLNAMDAIKKSDRLQKTRLQQMQRSAHLRFFLIVALFFCSQSGIAGNVSPEEKTVTISGNAIQIPVNLIALVKQGRSYCAIKITQTTEDPKGRGYYAKYEAVFQGDGSGDFNRSSAKQVSGELSILQPVRIIGRLSISRGDPNIYCGNITVQTSGYLDSAWLYFGRNKDLLLAPTTVEFSDINVFDSELKWYGYDENRQDFELQTGSRNKENPQGTRPDTHNSSDKNRSSHSQP